MKNSLFPEDQDLSSVFEAIKGIPALDPLQVAVAQAICNQELDQNSLYKILKTNGAGSTSEVKEKLMDLLILYINFSLNDHMLSDNEKRNINLMKRLFKIQEGEFYRLRYSEIREILYKQLERIYRDDDRIDMDESLHKVDLQDIFDLSYDQMLEFKEREIRLAMERGAELGDLDTVRYPDKIKFKVLDDGYFLHEEIKEQVWERDGGACIKCGTTKNIGFYPVIPFGLGGSGTYRNIRVMCNKCPQITDIP